MCIAGPGSRHYVSTAAAFVEPSNYTLELVSPRAAGTAPSLDDNIATGATINFPTGHRIAKAYPGLEYNIRAIVMGGAFPFTFSLSNQPAGMTVNATTGEISWPDPTGTTETPTLTVTDAEGTQIAEPWTITITTDGFYFVDAVSGSDAAAGTLAAPWQTLPKVWDTVDLDGIVYFKTGTYGPSGCSGRMGAGTSADDRIEMPANAPRIWLAYPGATPVYDCGYGAFSTFGTFIRTSGLVYFDGISFTNSNSKLLQLGSGNYKVVRRCDFTDIIDGVDGSNPSAVDFIQHYGTYDYYLCMQDNTYTDFAGSGSPGAFKLYSQKKSLAENLLCTNTGPSDPKAACPRYEIRACKFVSTAAPSSLGIYGNYDAQINDTGGSLLHEQIGGEVRFNLIDCPNATFSSYQVWPDQEGTYATRNTIKGKALVRWISGDEDMNLARNVIINADTSFTDHVWVTNASDATVNPPYPANIILTDNLSGVAADGILDASGALQGSYLTQYGPSTATPRGCIPSYLP